MPDAPHTHSPGSAELRSDIDALVMGAVYGELTPAEQARLSAHLEAHPDDQRALDDLRAARHMIRDSRILDHQVDPPQSMSALLLQEAARRAPKPDAEAGWFARFVGMVVAHPALASVASLVLVVGVTGTLYLKNGEVPVAERPMGQSAGARASSSATAAAPMEEEAGAAPTHAAASDKDAVPVRLDDISNRGKGMELREGKRGVAYDPTTEPHAKLKAKAALAIDAKPEVARAKSDDPGKSLSVSRTDDPRVGVRDDDPGKSLTRDARVPTANASRGTRDEARPAKKSAQNVLADSLDAPSDRSSEVAADGESDRDESPASQFATAPQPAAPATDTQQRRQAQPAANAQQQAAPVASAPRPEAQTGNAQRSSKLANVQQSAPATKAQQKAPFANAPRPAAPAGPAPQQAAPVAAGSPDGTALGAAGGYGGGTSANDEAAYGRRESAKQEAQSSTWARDTHRRVLAFVRAGKCQDASPYVQQLRTRDPNYYAANLAGDRTLGPCLSRIAEAAERDAKSRKKEAARAGAAQ